MDGARVAARDEDGFTLAATALERLDDISRALLPPTRVLLVGDLPPTADADLVRFLGFPVPTERFGTGLAGLEAAVVAATNLVRATEPVLVVAVDLPSVTESLPGNRRGPHSDAAVAVRFGERAAPGATLVFDGGGDRRGSATLPVLRLGRERVGAEPDAWVGDFVATDGPAPSLGSPHVGRPTIPSDGPVSQGAYVPRPRYLETLASRWRFAGERCASCGTITFPPRGRCRQCAATQNLESVRLPRDGGQVVASTTVGPGGQPTEFDEQVASTGRYGVVLGRAGPGCPRHASGRRRAAGGARDRVPRRHPAPAPLPYGRGMAVRSQSGPPLLTRPSAFPEDPQTVGALEFVPAQANP